MTTKKRPSLDAIDSILGVTSETENVQVAQAPQKVGRPRQDEYECRTFRVRRDLVKKLRIIAVTEGRLQKDILDYALETVISKYEKKHGEIDTAQELPTTGNIKEIF